MHGLVVPHEGVEHIYVGDACGVVEKADHRLHIVIVWSSFHVSTLLTSASVSSKSFLSFYSNSHCGNSAPHSLVHICCSEDPDTHGFFPQSPTGLTSAASVGQ